MDGYAYNCINRNCRYKINVRTGTFFNTTTYTIMELSRVVFHYFVRTYNATQTYHEMREMVNNKINPDGEFGA